MNNYNSRIEDEKEPKRPEKKAPFLWRFMDGFGKVFALNLCFVVGCLPVFTVGASLSALYAMCIRLQEDEEETIVSGFVREFKRSFKQATAAYLLVLLALFIMYFEFLVVKTVTGFWSTVYTGVLITECIFMGLIVPFLFPLIARYDNKLSVNVRNAMALTISYFWSWVKFVVAWFAPIFLCIRYPFIFANIWYLWLLLLFGLIAYGTSSIMRKIFRLNEQHIEDYQREQEEKRRKAEEEQEEAEEEQEEAEEEQEKTEE